MSHRAFLFFAAALSSLCIGLSQTTTAQSFGALDVKSCFSDILVDKSVDKRDVNVRYSLQQQWSRDLYEKAKQSNTLTVWIDGATGQDSYEASNEKRLQEMYKMSLDYNYSSNTAAYRARLNPQAKDIITRCLDSLGAKRGIVLYWVPFVHSDDPTLIDLELRFQYHPTDKPLHVQTKRIDNAEVLDDNHGHPADLFARSWNPLHSHIFDYDELMPYESRFVTLKRKTPADTVTIQITTDPNLSVPPITIEPEPRPQECGPVVITQDDASRPLRVEIPDIAIDNPGYYILNKDGKPSPEGNGVSFRVQENLAALVPPDADMSTAMITNTKCQRWGSPVDYMDWTYPNDKFPLNTCCLGEVNNVVAPDGLVATCRGWWQNPGRHIKMTIDWQKTGFKCTPHDWKYDNNKWH
jgi:Skp family chaperone for outer membrane proteins